MFMDNTRYISYLNSLHNYNAQNPNAYGEKNVNNEFFSKVAVKVSLCSYIERLLKGNKPHLLILTGHAGDGKTSIMYQVIKNFGAEFNVNEKISEVKLPTGKSCRCIKDYSELHDAEKLKVLKECVNLPFDDKFVFIVSNTGPIINTFGELFPDVEKEKAKIDLIDAIDSNSGEIKNIHGISICVINVASIDNTDFAVDFVKNLIQTSLWEKCADCPKKAYCHILRNRNLIEANQERVFEFLKDHYVWLFEHGTRLTIRSMTEQLAYMLTGGFECNQVISMEKHKLLFFNLFFGYIGLKYNECANTILAVKEARKCNYCQKRLRADEMLFIGSDYSVFGKDLADIIIEAQKNNGYISGWQEFIRRAYIFTNIVTDSADIERDNEDIFSKQFKKFLELREGTNKPSKQDLRLITEALSMIYLGTISDDENIPITLSKESGLSQNVQLITGYIITRNLSLISNETGDLMFDENHRKHKLGLMVEKKPLNCTISLPMLNYFEDLRNGVIPTNIDPQLSHGVESLKAQLSSILSDTNDNTIEMVVLKNNNNCRYKLEITDDNKIRSI